MVRAAWLLFVSALLLAPVAAEARKKDQAEAERCRALAALGRSAPPMALLLAGFDKNLDALVTRDELKAGIAAAFAAADADGNGEIGLAELGVWAEKWLGSADARPGRFDFDSSGVDRITRAEFEAELTRRFAALDTDRDGVVARSELLTVRPDQGCGPLDRTQPPARR